MGYYPAMIDVTGRRCLVVGGGAVGARKALALREAGALVTVIAPQLDPALGSVDGVKTLRREYRAGDVAGYILVFAAAGDRSVNAAVAADAKAAGIPANVVDDPDLCTFIAPSVVRRDDLIIAVSTSGACPALAKRIRREIEERYGPEYGALVKLMAEMRPLVRARFDDRAERDAAFRRMLESGILELLMQGRMDEARERALKCIS